MNETECVCVTVDHCLMNMDGFRNQVWIGSDNKCLFDTFCVFDTNYIIDIDI